MIEIDGKIYKKSIVLKALRLYKDLQDGRLAAAIEEAVKDEL